MCYLVGEWRRSCTHIMLEVVKLQFVHIATKTDIVLVNMLYVKKVSLEMIVLNDRKSLSKLRYAILN